MIVKKSRRGISTIVGALIFTVLMLGAFSALSLALDFQTDLVNVQQSVADKGIKKTQEEFSISAMTDQNNILNLYVDNKGQNSLEISSVWILNKSDPSKTATMYEVDFDESHVPAGYSRKILENNPLSMNSGEYELKVVSSLGNIKKTTIQNNGKGSGNLLKADIFMVPPEVLSGQNGTMAMLVTNLSGMKIDNVTASTPTIISDTAVEKPLPENPKSVSLDSKDSVLFKWDYKFIGPEETSVTFKNNASGIMNGDAVISNEAVDYMTIGDVDEGSGEGDIVIKDELFAKPEIFMIIPNPFGESDQFGIWGINIANPTNKTMLVNKVTVSIMVPGANDNQKLFLKDCELTSIFPATGWGCPNENQLVWKNIPDPLSVPPLSVSSYIVKVEPGKVVTGSEGLDSVVVHTGVFTTLGAFGKTQYETSMTNGNDVLANVYLSKNVNSTNNSEILGSVVGIGPGDVTTFNATMAELNSKTDHIKNGTKLIINIPKNWELITPLNLHGGFTNMTINEFPDNSTQIVGSLSSDLLFGARTIQFDAKAPSPTSEKMYIMHILASGESNNGRPIGALSEAVLQVDP